MSEVGENLDPLEVEVAEETSVTPADASGENKKDSTVTAFGIEDCSAFGWEVCGCFRDGGEIRRKLVAKKVERDEG